MGLEGLRRSGCWVLGLGFNTLRTEEFFASACRVAEEEPAQGYKGGSGFGLRALGSLEVGLKASRGSGFRV